MIEDILRQPEQHGERVDSAAASCSSTKRPLLGDGFPARDGSFWKLELVKINNIPFSKRKKTEVTGSHSKITRTANDNDAACLTSWRIFPGFTHAAFQTTRKWRNSEFPVVKVQWNYFTGLISHSFLIQSFMHNFVNYSKSLTALKKRENLCFLLFLPLYLLFI